MLDELNSFIEQEDRITHCEPVSADHFHDHDTGKIYKPAAVSEACEQLYNQCYELVSEEKIKFPLIMLGGDHSTAIGSIGGVFDALSTKTSSDGLDHANPVVIWFDAHADINTLKTTNSGNIHGCPVAFLMSHPDTKDLDPFNWFYEKIDSYANRTGSAFIDPSRLAYIGLRDVEDGEKDTMKEYGVHNAWFMEDINEAGRDMEAMVKSILDNIDPKGDRPIHFSIDVDGIDPDFIPSTGTPVPGGITLEETLKIVELVMKTGRVVSIDIVEVNLFLGTKNDSEKTLKNTVEVLRRILNK